MRVFGADQPSDVKVVHSWYWRSPHFTYEFEYFFELSPNEALRKHIVGSGNILKIDPSVSTDRDRAVRFFNSKPTWFLPKPIESYDIWGAKAAQENFRIFIDRSTGELFLTDYSV